MSHFAFLQPEWPALFEAASKAEALALPGPRTSCFYSRRSLELVVDWVYTHDSALTTPYQTEHGVMSPALLYETPFIDFHHAGPNGLFSPDRVEELMGVLEHIRAMAIAA